MKKELYSIKNRIIEKEKIKLAKGQVYTLDIDGSLKVKRYLT